MPEKELVFDPGIGENRGIHPANRGDCVGRLVPRRLYPGNSSMNTKAEDLLANALTLPESERAEIAAQLIASLGQTVDAEAQEAWDAEIARRIEELDSGKVETLPWSEVRRMLFRTFDDTGATGLLAD